MRETFGGEGARIGSKRVLLLLLLVLLTGAALGHYFSGVKLARESLSGQEQLWTCGMHPQVIQNKPGNCPICGMALEPVRGQKESTFTGAVQIDPVMIQNMGVRIAQPTAGPLEQSIRAVGYLNWAEPKIYDVNLRISGWIDKLYADTEGAAISDGQPLFDLYSPELQVAVGELIAARRSAGNVQDRGVSQTLVDAGRRKLEQWGLGTSQIEKLARMESAPRAITFISPVSGEVIEKNIVEGAAVMSGQRVLRIANRNVVWLDSQVYAMDVAAVKVGQSVTAAVEGFPGAEFRGEVLFIDPRIDPATRTAKVRIALPNSGLLLKPGMFATVFIKTRLADNATLIPREAVLDTGVRQVVFVALEGGRFEPRDVKLGRSGDGGVAEVLSGLAPADKIVISGQFLLDAESRMKEAIHKHLSRNLAAQSSSHVHAAPQAHSQDASSVKHLVSQKFSLALDETVREYLNLSAFFGKVQTSTEPAGFGALIKSAEVLKEEADQPGQKAAVDQLLDMARPLAGVSQDEQRNGFKTVSGAVLKILEQWPPSQRVTGEDGKLFVLYCPMANGYWLQDTSDAPANPYYAKEMKACAEVKRAIEALPENARD